MATDLLPLLLLAGMPGSGKTTVASHLYNSAVISMDDFYLAEDDARLPRRGKKPDWDSRASLDIESLQRAIESLLKQQAVEVPRYDMQHSRPSGNRLIDPRGTCAVVVEGVFAFDLKISSVARISRVLLVSYAGPLFLRRIRRDVSEGRYSSPSALFQAIHLLFRYKNYETIEAQRADFIFANRGLPSNIAIEISEQIGYWDKC